MTKGLDLGTEAGRLAEQHLHDDVVGWLTTVSPDGRPQSSVISFLWDGETILFYSKPDAPKVRNLAANPRVSFHLNCDPYGDHMVTIEGRALVDEAAAASDVLPDYRAKYLEPLAHWGMDEAETAAAFSLPIRIIPERFRVW
ncbi:MAG: TIGR03667 family PPOX class F420-dependent oxidoreductase [Actinobacteria bacterium]|nr:TIGR03667 family PPOX class F420-dependent oxidoreductase [Actinomycetota bacterium]